MANIVGYIICCENVNIPCIFLKYHDHMIKTIKSHLESVSFDEIGTARCHLERYLIS